MSPDGGGGRTGSSGRFTPDFLTELFRNPLDAGYAEAARRRAAGDRGTPAGRATARTSRLVALAMTGFLFAVAYQHVVAAAPQTNQARARLVTEIRSRQHEANALQRHAEQLREEVNRARDAALPDSAARLRDLGATAGLVKVTGDGATVRLADAPPQVDPVTGKASDTNLGRVLDRDLQDVTNQLWRDGAEAIGINGERLTATSTIRQAGGAILVDFQPVTSPYQVTAIGPGDLADKFRDSGTGRRFGRYAHSYGMKVTISDVSGVTLPAAADPGLSYARTIPTPGPSTGSASGSARSGAPAPSGGVPGGTGSPVPSSSGGG